MVWPFKNRKEVVDLTILAKRGLIKPEAEEVDYKDLTPIPADETGLSFLGNLAGAGGGTEVEKLHLNSERNKIEDIEFKLDLLSRKLNSMIDRLDLTEKKIDRIERKS